MLCVVYLLGFCSTHVSGSSSLVGHNFYAEVVQLDSTYCRMPLPASLLSPSSFYWSECFNFEGFLAVSIWIHLKYNFLFVNFIINLSLPKHRNNLMWVVWTLAAAGLPSWLFFPLWLIFTLVWMWGESKGSLKCTLCGCAVWSKQPALSQRWWSLDDTFDKVWDTLSQLGIYYCSLIISDQ